MVRLVVELLTHRLADAWQLVPAEKADVWLIDTQRTDVSHVLNDRGEDITVLAVLESFDTQRAVRAIYRPLSPRVLIDALNDIDVDKPIQGTTQTLSAGESPRLMDWRPTLLVDAFRAAAKNGRTGLVAQIEGIDDHSLLVDAERDRLYGPHDGLTMDQFVSEAQFQTRLVSREVAEDILDQKTERKLESFLIELANTSDTCQCLFGNIYRSKIQLNTESDLSELPVKPTAIQALTLVRHDAYTLVEAAELVCVEPDELLPLFNALYINGMLDVVEGQYSADDSVSPESGSPNEVSSRFFQEPAIAKEAITARPAFDLTQLCQRQINAMRESEQELVYAVIASRDGYEMVSASAQGWAISFSHLVGVAQTGQALGVNVFEDLVQGRCRDVTIETTELDIVFQSVPGLESPPLILGLAAPKSMDPDRMLSSARCCVERISNEWFENFHGPIKARK